MGKYCELHGKTTTHTTEERTLTEWYDPGIMEKYRKRNICFRNVVGRCTVNPCYKTHITLEEAKAVGLQDPLKQPNFKRKCEMAPILMHEEDEQPMEGVWSAIRYDMHGIVTTDPILINDSYDDEA